MHDKVLITGATGLLGQHIVRKLLDRGSTVRAFVRNDNQRSLLPEGVELFVGDIRDENSVCNAVKGCDSVIHGCSTHEYGLPYETFHAVNVIGAKNICNAVVRSQCKRLVFTSTVSTLHSQPQTADLISSLPPRKRMSLTKRVAEEDVLVRSRKGLPAIIINPSYFIGPYDYHPSPFRLWVPLAIKRPVRFAPQGGFNVVSVRDVSDAHVWALENGRIGERYPVVGHNLPLIEYVSMINNAAGHPLTPTEVSPGLLRRIAFGKVFDEYVAELISRKHFTAISNYLGNTPERLEKTIDETVAWFAHHSTLTNIWPLARYVWNRYI